MYDKIHYKLKKKKKEKAEEPEIKLPTSVGSSKKQQSSRKTSASASLTTRKTLTVWIISSCEKFLNTWDYQTILPASWETCMQVKEAIVRTRKGATDLFKIGKRVHQGCILSPWLFHFYAEYIMWNAGLEKAQTRIKIAGRSVNNLR